MKIKNWSQFAFLVLLLATAKISAQAEEKIPNLPSEVQAVLPEMVEPVKKEDATIFYQNGWGTSSFFDKNATNMGLPRSANLFELSGYLRTRFNYFYNPHLKTFIPSLGLGTSNFRPNQEMIVQDLQENSEKEKNPSQHIFGANMRLRLDPTINISQVMRIRSTFDILDNLVLGSTPSYMTFGAPNPSQTVPMMSLSQHAPNTNINSLTGAIQVKRAWGEATFPIGELRFGRMPMHWGLGILYNSGDNINADYGDQIDGVTFSTRVFDHYITPGYSIAYTGPIGRGGGHFNEPTNGPAVHLPAEPGQRYPLDSNDLTHVFMLSFLKREAEFNFNLKKSQGEPIFQYGLLTSYRRQYLDTQTIYLPGQGDTRAFSNQRVKRNGHIGLGSFWSAFTYKHFHMELEFAGIWGKYRYGDSGTERLAKNGTNISQRDMWLLQGGIALETRYGFLNDRLQLGFDSGYASTQEGPGFGIREGSNLDPQPGHADGVKNPKNNKFKTNFKFNPAYKVDLLLHREVLGTVASSVYFKPNLAYFFSRNFGLRGDFITTIAPDKSNTPGNSNWLGVEFDAAVFLRSDNGLYFSLDYGILFPLKGLDHRKTENIKASDYTTYGTSRLAQTIQLYLGLLF